MQRQSWSVGSFHSLFVANAIECARISHKDEVDMARVVLDLPEDAGPRQRRPKSLLKLDRGREQIMRCPGLRVPEGWLGSVAPALAPSAGGRMFVARRRVDAHGTSRPAAISRLQWVLPNAAHPQGRVPA